MPKGGKYSEEPKSQEFQIVQTPGTDNVLSFAPNDLRGKESQAMMTFGGFAPINGRKQHQSNNYDFTNKEGSIY
eukprot:CAMPEP_0202961140 /NCGR_PEP_ID=MMETSP1396-20130829/5209_1 /ASSEMBLY_ACC=CAM_ASM_000872 /TAXON_ID= /ORGANISM="Pseudokeronopsis sp., Strain Brazil" /LENGTH=73 /DNA_ID=CAMNT_0049680753 /DNA_START=272 /DNA_END=493 /DNA_ORIENTATION=-